MATGFIILAVLVAIPRLSASAHTPIATMLTPNTTDVGASMPPDDGQQGALYHNANVLTIADAPSKKLANEITVIDLLHREYPPSVQHIVILVTAHNSMCARSRCDYYWAPFLSACINAQQQLDGENDDRANVFAFLNVSLQPSSWDTLYVAALTFPIDFPSVLVIEVSRQRQLPSKYPSIVFIPDERLSDELPRFLRYHHGPSVVHVGTEVELRNRIFESHHADKISVVLWNNASEELAAAFEYAAKNLRAVMPFTSLANTSLEVREALSAYYNNQHHDVVAYIVDQSADLLCGFRFEAYDFDNSADDAKAAQQQILVWLEGVQRRRHHPQLLNDMTSDAMKKVFGTRIHYEPPNCDARRAVDGDYAIVQLSGMSTDKRYEFIRWGPPGVMLHIGDASSGLPLALQKHFVGMCAGMRKQVLLPPKRVASSPPYLQAADGEVFMLELLRFVQPKKGEGAGAPDGTSRKPAFTQNSEFANLAQSRLRQYKKSSSASSQPSKSNPSPQLDDDTLKDLKGLSKEDLKRDTGPRDPPSSTDNTPDASTPPGEPGASPPKSKAPSRETEL